MTQASCWYIIYQFALLQGLIDYFVELIMITYRFPVQNVILYYYIFVLSNFYSLQNGLLVNIYTTNCDTNEILGIY